jgi:SAM-dependent methyltransferase
MIFSAPFPSSEERLIEMANEEELTKRYYSKKVLYEWKRLVQDPFHKLEFDTTMRFLEKHLPGKGLILDAGGGPGRYAIELARRGYSVVLLDLVPELLAKAKREIKRAKVESKIEDIVEGSITDLSGFGGNSFDAVICLGGSLSHVHPEGKRKQAVSEMIKVAKRKAPIFVSVMGKFGVLLATPEGWPAEVEKENFLNISSKGDDYRWCKTGYCHFFTLEELEALFPKRKVEILERVGLEGLNISRRATNRFSKEYPEAWKNWMKIHDELCTHTTVVDASGHMLIIVGKR